MFAMSIIIVRAINWLTIYKFKKIIDSSKSQGKIQLHDQPPGIGLTNYSKNEK